MCTIDPTPLDTAVLEVKNILIDIVLSCSYIPSVPTKTIKYIMPTGEPVSVIIYLDWGDVLIYKEKKEMKFEELVSKLLVSDNLEDFKNELKFNLILEKI